MSSSRLKSLLDEIDRLNAADPNTTLLEGKTLPCELIYGQRMSQCLNQFNPDAGELLQIAVRAQHLERWVLARSDFPEGRSGYKKWRSQLALHHASRTAELMQNKGFSDEEIERVKYLLQKRGLKRDDEAQCLEDVACLVFLRFHFEDFAEKHSQEKLINILQLTWKKMSEKAQQVALATELKPHLAELLSRALSSY